MQTQPAGLRRYGFLPVAALTVAANGLIAADFTPNGRLGAEIDGRRYYDPISLNYERYKRIFEEKLRNRSGTLDIPVRKDTALARKLSEVAQTKKGIPQIEVEGRAGRDTTVYGLRLQTVMIDSLNMHRGAWRDSDTTDFRLRFRRVAQEER